MAPQLSLIQAKRAEILALAAKHGAKNIRLFGSVRRGNAKADSDIDFLVEAAPQHSPFFPGGLLMDLQELLGYPVDVVEPEAIHWYIRDNVLKEAIPL